MLNISIDTGGTFTDCILKNTTTNEQKKLKILSTAVLRLSIGQVLPDLRFQIIQSYALKENFFKGFYIRFIDNPSAEYKIEKFDALKSIIILNKSIIREVKKGNICEIYSKEEVPVLACRLLTNTALNEPFPEINLRIGTTRGTNALLEGKGAKTLLVVSKGFKDLLKIGNQARPLLFELNYVYKPQPYQQVLEIDEQTNADGSVEKTIDLAEVEKQLKTIYIADIEAVAISFKNAYSNNTNELLLKKYLAPIFKNIVIGSEKSTLPKYLIRSQSATVNAYLQPIINNYINKIYDKIKQPFQLMTSAGFLQPYHSFTAIDSLLSGPAGGFIAAVNIAKQCNISNIISFDMGGTSTDVALYNGNFEYNTETKISDYEVFTPSIPIETVAAGGGSICGFDGQKLFVGPQSAGSMPGPACYGAGGPFCITDVNLLLGKIDASLIPIPIFFDQAQKEFDKIILEITTKTGNKPNETEILEGFILIANENMAEAAKKISISKGHNTKNHALIAFGGMGGLHACQVAQLLQIETIILPSNAGLLSAEGISHAKLKKVFEYPVLQNFIDINWLIINDLIYERIKQSILESSHLFGPNLKFAPETVLLKIGQKGQEFNLEIPFFENSTFENTNNIYEEYFEKIFNYLPKNVEREVFSVKITICENDNNTENEAVNSLDINKNNLQTISFEATGYSKYPIFNRKVITPGTRLDGPCIIIDPFASHFLEKGWAATSDKHDNIHFWQTEQVNIERKNAEIIDLELFSNRFMAIANQMGKMLERTALSVNVRERLDFSCAILDAKGFLVANAPHIPVHLGSLGVCVRSVILEFPLAQGDIIILNHPKFGGSHLPDITLIKAVFDQNHKLIAYVCNRAHHADIGGIRPGSMPPNATKLIEEGKIILPFYLFKNNKSYWPELQDIFSALPYPSRNVALNLADIQAAVASLNTGEQLLLQLSQNYGVEKLRGNFEKIQNYSAKILNEKLATNYSKSYSGEEYFDDNSKIVVKINFENSHKITFDFTGTSTQHKGNLNANEAIVRSVIMYVMRLIANDNIPLNEGLMQNVELILPEKSMLNPDFSGPIQMHPAVVGGNVETSQKLCNLLLTTLGISAGAQGTMNNTLFGNDNFGYYETIGGGGGASAKHNGLNACQQHMTNTRITDAEIFERNYPARLARFEIKEKSGGAGEYLGGNGLIREIEFLDKVKISILSQSRKIAPKGLKGGKNGALGTQRLVKANGKIVELDGFSSTDANAHDRLIIETPGGGGWGSFK